MYISRYVIAKLLKVEESKIKQVKLKEDKVSIRLQNCEETKLISVAEYRQYLQEFRNKKQHHNYYKVAISATIVSVLTFATGYFVNQSVFSNTVTRRNVGSTQQKDRTILLVNLALLTGTVTQSVMLKKTTAKIEVK